jgi:hypothetical protein
VYSNVERTYYIELAKGSINVRGGSLTLGSEFDGGGGEHVQCAEFVVSAVETPCIPWWTGFVEREGGEGWTGWW